MRNSKPKNNINQYTPIGESHCEGKCDRKVVPTKSGVMIVCDGCIRVVIDNRHG